MKRGIVAIATTLFLCPYSYGQESEQQTRIVQESEILTWVARCLQNPRPCVGAHLTVNEYGDETYEFTLEMSEQEGRLTRQSSYLLRIPKWIVGVTMPSTNGSKAPEAP